MMLLTVHKGRVSLAIGRPQQSFVIYTSTFVLGTLSGYALYPDPALSFFFLLKSVF